MRAHIFLALMIGTLVVALGLLLKEANLSELFSKKAFWDAFVWSLWLGFISVILAFLVSIISLYLPKTILILALFGIILPPFLLGMGLTWVSIQFSLGQGALYLAHTLSVLPYMLFFFRLAHGRIDEKLKAQARLHSGSLWVQLRFFYLPVMAPSLGAGTAVGVSVSLAQYMLSLLLSSKPTISTQMVPLLHSGQLSGAAGYGAVYVMLAPIVILSIAWALKGELWRPYM